VALATAGAGLAASRPRRPNIVLIISDDHRWDALGAAGNRAVRTPALDRLAKTGLYFPQATVHVPQCSPSRATLLTGLPPHQHGVYSNQYRRPDIRQADRFPVATMPGLLRDSGYRTAFVGKWHLPPDPWSCGFTDVRLWLPGGGGPYLDPSLARGNSRETAEMKGYTNGLFTDDAVEFLKSDAAREKPFLLWLALTTPHVPYGPNPPHVEELYEGKTQRELLPPGFPSDIPTGNWQRYYEAVTFLDEQVARVIQTLDERKLSSETVLIFVGDNGYMMGSRGIGARGGAGKVVPNEESVKIPLIIRAPGLQRGTGIRNAPVSTLDLPPTLLQLAGVKPPPEWAGRDLGPLLRGVREHAVQDAFCEWADDRSTQFGHLSYRLVRTPGYKLVRWETAGKPDELYDLDRDPRETTNLIASPALRIVRENLRARLVAWMERTGDPAREWKKPAAVAPALAP
jgi:arylsulfatase A-like enzyme